MRLGDKVDGPNKTQLHDAVTPGGTEALQPFGDVVNIGAVIDRELFL